ncbi:hypothetical protein OC845_004276 [Tilletia horrida]|nr:hypothetical protein OC845_004276 [Tilletia horrida]
MPSSASTSALLVVRCTRRTVLQSQQALLARSAAIRWSSTDTSPESGEQKRYSNAAMMRDLLAKRSTASAKGKERAMEDDDQQASQGTPTAESGHVALRFRASSTGEWYNITDARLGETLKDVAQRHRLPSIEATCGGQCECATCHAYFVTARAGAGKEGEPDLDVEPPEDVFPERSEEEDDMLDYAVDRKASSRLTCQLKVTSEIRDWMQTRGGWIELPKH